MKPVQIKENIYWVGGIDWDLRNFHGYLTQRGSTYNAYLILDEKITLVDTVKTYLYDEMLSRIKHIVDPSKIDFIVANHVEMDHSGSLPKILEVAKKATVITSPNGQKGLIKHFGDNFNFKIVNTGEKISLGKNSLEFFPVPMVHWPDSMVTYNPENKLLLSNDAFGQHIASSERFDDQLGLSIVEAEAKKYYANIVLPYARQVNKALEALSSLDIDMIAPSHGVIWRKHLKEIISLYEKWANNETVNSAVIVYDTMWHSTEKMAYKLVELFEQKQVAVKLMNLAVNHISDVMTEVMTAKYICVGSPTLNNGILPTISAFLTYMKGLAPKNRIGVAFGSYGWGGQSIKQIEDILQEAGFSVPVKELKLQYVPTEDDLDLFIEKVNAIF